jgi:TRAP-type C4-dicarboxylate transport system substrate-binding protein
VGYFPSQLPMTTLLDLPFLTNNSQALLASLLQIYGEFDGMKKEYENNNLVLLTGLAGDPTILGSREPLRTIEDLKGKRIRAFGLINQALDTLGGVPVALPAPDIYASMERKVIDAYSGLPASLIPPWSLHEVSKYVIDYGGGLYAANAIVMNKPRFTGLNEKTQALLLDTFSELVKDVYIADLAKLNRERAKAIQDSKMEIFRWTKEERAKAIRSGSRRSPHARNGAFLPNSSSIDSCNSSPRMSRNPRTTSIPCLRLSDGRTKHQPRARGTRQNLARVRRSRDSMFGFGSNTI